MKAILLAAGQGERLRPLTNKIPKVMIPIGQLPLLEYNIRLLKRNGFDEIAINLFWHGETIRKYFKDGKKWSVKIFYSDEKEILGTAGGAKKCAKLLKLKDNEPILVYYGDNLTNLNLKKLLAYHLKKKADLTIAVIERQDVKHSGILVLDKSGRVKRFIEKPKEEPAGYWVNAAIYFMNSEVLELIPSNQSYDFGHDLIPKLLEVNRKVFAYKLTGGDYLLWIDTKDDYEIVQKIISKGMVRLE